MSAADDPKHPLWQTFDSEDPPELLHAGYYQGLSGRWLMTSVGQSIDPAKFIVSLLDQPGVILTYKLVAVEEFPMDERLKFREQHTRQGKTKVNQPKVRKPKLRVRKPIGK